MTCVHLPLPQVWLYQGYRSGDLKQLVDAAVNQRTEIRLIPVCVGAAALLVFGVWWATARYVIVRNICIRIC